MLIAVADDDSSSIQTRPSLLNRLKTGDDAESWQEFYRVYGKVARDFAIQAGLTDTEADEVVQETAISIARHLPNYQYDPKVCRFKTWLLNVTSWRVKDQLKKRKKDAMCVQGNSPESQNDDTTRTSTIDSVPALAEPNYGAIFETQWRKSLFDAALERVKQKFSLKQFQIFDLLVLQEWPARDVARSLGVTLANVYVTKHRVSVAIKKETNRLESRLEQAAEQRTSGCHTGPAQRDDGGE
jgi:RNA polymerase sigma-70 factor (ECF subfamily)